MIDVTLLGTAALMPLPERALAAAAITCAGRSILLDCGEGTQTAARKLHVSLLKTDLIALTHYHGDHIFGLPGLLQTMFSLGRTEPLYITGPDAPAEMLKPILLLAGRLSYEIRVIDADDGDIPLHALNAAWPARAVLKPFMTEHRSVSCGYAFTLGRAGKFLPQKAKELGIPVPMWSRLQNGAEVEADGRVFRPEDVLGEAREGLKVVYSGDTAACDLLTENARNADLLICEATYGEDEQLDLALEHGHMNFAQAGETAAKANAKRLWLTHYSQMVTDPEEYIANARRSFPEAECGTDGMRIPLAFENN